MSEQNFHDRFQALIDRLGQNEKVRAIGLSGGDRPFPEPGQGDIDIFIYCSEIPDKDQRQQILAADPQCIDRIYVGCMDDPNWGHGDTCYVQGVEIWLLYFTLADAKNELEDILTGDYRWRVDNYYYPLGRCAMWKTIRVLYDVDGMLSGFKKRLTEYPASLQQKVVEFHLAGLKDHEDLERAVLRKDVFFYHFAFDLALDHFFQLLFALNRTYFPSRKRSEQYIQGFEIKPVDCERRLKQALSLGGVPDSVAESYSIWKKLADDLISLAGSPMEEQLSPID